MDRLLVNPTTIESQAILKATVAIMECEGELTETDLFALSSDAMRLVDRFATDRLALRYSTHELEAIVGKLKRLL